MTFSVVIVGLGQIGMGYDLLEQDAGVALTHARGFSQHPAFRLAGGVDSSAVQRALFEKHYNQKSYSRVQDAIEEQQPDVVVVATPTAMHGSTVREVLSSGSPRAILCEKPIAYDPAEARQLVELCATRGCQMFVNYMRRSDRSTAEIKRRLDSGAIARPEKIVVWYSKGLLNNGSHFLNLLEHWMGEVSDLQVISPGRTWGDADPEPDISIRFANGGTAYFLMAREENYSHYTMELITPNGRLFYGRGGEDIRWQAAVPDPVFAGYTVLSPAEEIIENELGRAQWHVADQLSERLYAREGQICDARDALRTLETLGMIKDRL